MNAIRFYQLLREIFGQPIPNTNKIENLGLLAVKIGQMFALRPDFLSEEACRSLAKLYRSTTPVSVTEVEILLSKNAPPGFKDNFISFNNLPVASASVGQVHRAVLASGQEVAVKLLKADVASDFKKEVKQVRRLLKIALAVYPKLKGVANPSELIGQIEKTTLAELDLRNEARGYKLLGNIADKWRDYFDLRHLGKTVVYEEFSNSRVLVTEFLNGPTLDELLEKRQLKYDQLLEFFKIQGFYTYAEGIFHGDIHPGNIILQNDKFYFVDAGYIGQVEKKLRVGLLNFFDALSQYDYEQSAEYLQSMSEVVLSPEKFKEFKVRFFKLYEGFKGASVSEVSLTQKMMETIRLGVIMGMRFGTGMYDIIKSHMYLDGMVLRCNPQAVLLPDMRRYVEEFKKFIKD